MITQSELKEILHYDPDTGIFTGIEIKRGCRKNGLAGYLKQEGYIQIKIFGKIYPAHRLAWLYTHGSFPINDIDHINGIRNDNRIINLREATHSQNQANKKYRNNSGYKGVSKNKNKWQANIKVGKKTLYLGYFDTKEEAHEAYKQASIKHHGEFAKW